MLGSSLLGSLVLEHSAESITFGERLCGNQIYGAFAMSVPHRSTEPARPYIAPDTLVDFHTGERVLENDDLRVQLCVS